MVKMRANGACFICISFLLLFCQLPKIDAKAKPDSDTYCQWSEGECSRSCGGGVRKATLTCLNNRSDGPSTNKGPKVKYTSCNTQECPDRINYRALQCAKYNKMPVDGHYYKWKPYYGDDADVCALVCAVNKTLHAKLADKVVDGTRCRPDGYDICVNGECKGAGCDRQLGSTLVDDACGVCGGEGKDCKTVEGDYENENNKGYKDIITILKGASNIRIQEVSNTNNYFALRNILAKFYLNNQWKLTEHKKFLAAGTIFRYQKDSNGHILTARGPTTDALTLVLVGKGDPTKVHYEYYIPEKGHVSKPVSRMRRPQNKPKAQDPKRVQPNREEKPQGKRPDRLSRDEKPQTRRRTARNYPRPSADTPLPSGDAPPRRDPRRSAGNYEWVHGTWTKCSASCGEGIQRRAVQCFSMQTRELSEGLCPEENKPQDTQKCEMPCDNSYRWAEAGWTDCSQSCGGGEMSSVSICEETTKSGAKRVKESYCEETLGASPRAMKVCNEHQCQISSIQVAPPCWESLYGCCPDRRTAASGPDHAGCGESHAGCQNMQYGCCPDGVTAARGERYAGCPSVGTEGVPDSAPTVALLSDRGHVCHMKEDGGTCGDYETKYAYDASTGSCKQFWYGGCGGNENRFADERACLIACRGTQTTGVQPRPTVTSPRREPTSHRVEITSDVCQMKEDGGTCGDYETKYAYDASTGSCKQFWYGGCGGNDNRFADERACLIACRGTQTTRVQPRPTVTSPRREPTASRREPTAPREVPTSDVCQMKEDGGTCGDYETKYAYDASTGSCKQFWYGGCGGNDNRFEDERACLIACRGTQTTRVQPRPTVTSPRREPTAPREVPTSVASETRTHSHGTDGHVCEMEADGGSCGDYVSKWFYNSTSGGCQQFWYGGCHGNDNRFDSERDCQVKCRGRRVVGSSCTSTPFGCCEDGTTAARGPQKLGCPELDCSRSRYGCCPDGTTSARGQDQDGCESRDCRVSRYGCCQDGRSFAQGENYAGCRQLRCDESPYGCCPDGVSFAQGENYAGCRQVNECERTEFGCCPDQSTTAQGPNGEGCCHYTEFGCCPDGLTISGPNHERCRTQDCRRSRYGCCRDGVNFARGENFKGCPSTDCRTSEAGCCPDGVTFVSEGCAPPNCHSTSYGCCPDGQTIARGYFHEGCREKDCRQSKYGCCPDGASYAKGEEYQGCPTCRETKYGCCPDGTTVARGGDYLGCTLGSCHLSDYGCCPDMRTASLGPEHLGCKEKDCRQYRYGCCEDGVTYARGRNMDGCPKNVERCTLSRYGCCEDGRTEAQGPDRYGCPETQCAYSEFGCCEDGVTFARGREYEGCPGRRVRGCEATTYGCCQDGRTEAQGPDRYGCPETQCANSEFGCCEDRVTFARGRDFEGCPERRIIRGCAGTRYGCCQDERTAAQGPERYGCPETQCAYSEFGCCEDGVTFARGREHEGCPGRRVRGCEATTYGCCQDGRTEAQGPDRYGCPETQCANSEFGCCEDRVTFARGRDFEGCPERRIIGGCAGTRYGCCQDERTAAQGPERYGCPETQCANSEFGCCEDRVTFARGRDFEGCPERRIIGGCAGTRYGCCQDERTAAQGPERYGCPETQCANSEFGCCEDRVTFARGRNFEGCPERRIIGGCAGTRYGCCQDERTAAQGPERYGCPEIQNRDCSRSTYGCCPDRVSFARGPEYAGCEIDLGCEASAYGCCPDMATAARGPDYAGCPPGGCLATRYGCCPDRVTPADGPNYAGCDLRSNCESPYGCCPDGVTAARGPDYAGCAVPTVSTEVDCESDKDGGSCSEYVTKWYFNRNSSKCEQFWYGGCSGNNNRYDNERDCNRKCRRRRASPTDEAPLDPCHLPYDEGTCSSSNAVRRWYYEESSRSCQVFWYSGCDGNANNFESESTCVQRCFLHPTNETLTPTEPSLYRNPLEICHLELQAGACSKELIMWHYDKQDGLCKNFSYSGCYGNSNRFPSKESCEAVCSREAVCNFKEAYGTCQSNIRRYRYDAERGDCVAFRYSGCNGNANNFVTVDACRMKCGVFVGPSVATTTERQVETPKPTGLAACSVEKDESYCADGVQRSQIAWYYDLTLAACQQFNYSGCGGNNNRFTSAEECTRTCNPRDICQMPDEFELCSNSNKVWHFNVTTGKCESFYGRCGGNANRFPTKTICKKTCRALMSDPNNQPTVPSPKKNKDACVLPQKPGTCHYPVGENVWFYNMTEGTCQLFNSQACSYNDNRFSSRAECESTCNPRELCMLSSDSGTCSEYIRQYYFNPIVKRCELFVYGGCGGNANRFPTTEYCEKTCNALLDRNISTGPVKLPGNIKIAILMCHLSPDRGPCRSNERKWYYEVKEARCRQFMYGGCQGNENRFETREECESSCNPQVVCSFSRDAGNCTPYHRGYYFNSALGRCEHFSYGDCYGNANRFYSLDLCERTCKAPVQPPVVTTPAPEPTVQSTVRECHLPKETGSCRANLPMWFYDTEDNVCKQFTYGGCEGNANRFQTKEECEKTCNAYDICHLPQESGRCLAYMESFYFNPQSERCEPFVYGGCGGNANRFSSLANCHIVCRHLIQKPATPDPSTVSERPTRPVEVCHLEKKVGSCSDQISTWYYDMEDNTCKHFYYGGCEGNGNRFKTRSECESICNTNDICNLPKEAGRCYAYSMQYHFNPQTRRCEEFVYGGCGGNANRFSSIGKCLASCHSLIEQTTTHIITTDPTISEKPVDVCHLEKKVGTCRAHHRVWHYDAVDHQCKIFYYGGCDGNANNFASKEECENKCNHQRICELPKKTGHCYSYSEQYYFNSRTKRCEQFVYGGCGGNANRFASASKCMDVCKSLIEIMPTPSLTDTPPHHSVESCHLDKKVGPCRAQLPSWYYDATKHECKHFYYSGCDGNANRFKTSEKCHETCNPQSICTLPKESGKCYSYSEAYYFNPITKRCEQFVYGGCEGNANRFSSVSKCEDVCSSLMQPGIPEPTRPTHINPVESCHLEKKVGPCESQLPSWYYDIIKHECKHFYYGGCDGNANRFETNGKCHETCKPESICTLPKESGKCYSYSEQYYFNPITKRCEQFVYGGCGGNANRFSSVSKCEDVCSSLMQPEIPEPTRPTHINPVESCHMDKKVGRCRSQLRSWYYDIIKHECKHFYYGGCNGNANRFESSEKCNEICNPQSICTLPKESGKCYSYSEQYYFNPITKRCEQFVYGGCGGNANRFSTISKCMDVCSSLMRPEIPEPTRPTHINPVESCHMDKKVGRCRRQLRSWYYDIIKHECKHFYYGGCDGNANRFESSEKCNEICNPQSICTLPKEPGKCYSYSGQYYFNPITKRCEQFVYGGCGGNANRFSTISKCMDVCSSLMRPEIPEPTRHAPINPELCQFPRASGSCFNYSEIYYFDQETNRCEQFVYSGCGGNANRFHTLSECRAVCRSTEVTKKPVTKIDVPDTPKRDKEVCRLRKLIGPCSYNITVWYFDENYGVCSMFIYSGCGGNKNNFKTLEECENVCRPTNDVCNNPMAVKQCSSSRAFWAYDKANRTCRYFSTGYCEDNPFQFSSESACHKQCTHQDVDAETDSICHFRMEEGPCRAYVRLWHYNMDEAICKPFIYGGCEGNKNRFDTKQKCDRVCNKHAICKLKKDPGICYAYSDAFYFNAEKNMCEHFAYGGCGGNANRFSSMNQCHNVCGGHLSNHTHGPEHKDKCRMEPESGSCGERNLHWYYDFKTGDCLRFYYTGCGGNDNRFTTQSECLSSCKQFSRVTPTYSTSTENSLVDPKNRFTTIHVAPKETLTLHCGELIDSTGEGNPVTWTHEGQDIIPNSRQRVKNLDLIVYDVTSKDTGLYSCREKRNTVTPTLDKYKVILKVPATIDYGPSHMSSLPNRQLAIPCQAHGVPQPLIIWYKDDRQIINDNHYHIFSNGTLLINPFQINDVGTFKCLANNGYEDKAEKKVKVAIQDSLNLQIKKSNPNLHVGDRITLTCIAEGYPNTRLQWFYKDRELYSNNRITVRDGVLIINKAAYDDSGIYTCRGTHGRDQVNKDESIRILSRPDEVPNVCEDRLPINRCRMIVDVKLCKRKTFHKNCCVSCSRSMASRR